ncbi:MAG: PBP1A family penicillin-binding protein [bacterium]|nr:PBP1A family penicillin-binding protein [bacterium]
MKTTIKYSTKSVPEQQSRSWFRFFLTWSIVGLVLFLFGGVGVYLVYLSFRSDLPSLSQLERFQPKLASKVFSQDSVLLHEFFVEKREFIPLSKIPKNLQNAVLSIEDHRFYQHWGVDLIGIGRALFVNLLTRRKSQGASTITQQLARQLYFGPEKWVTRKIKEQFTAIQIEKTYSKDEILEMYLTQVYFGHGAYGVGAASRRFFSKDVTTLKLHEAALLAGLIQTPGRHSPLNFPEQAKRRRNIVLKRMYELNVISKEQYDQAKNSPLDLYPSAPNDDLGIAPYFTELVRQELEEKNDVYQFDYLQDGLTIYTTLNAKLQSVLDQVVQNHMKELDKRFHPQIYRSLGGDYWLRKHYPDLAKKYRDVSKNISLLDSILPESKKLQIAAVAIDPRNGRVLAMVGGRNFQRSKFNRAVQSTRQPGSTFKPFVYLTALTKGKTPDDLVSNAPIVIQIPGQKAWRPKNYDGKYGGTVTYRNALKRSLNLCTIRVMKDVTGIDAVIDVARSMGITTPLARYLPLAIGSSGVKLIEMVNAYGAWGQNGILAQWHFIESVHSNQGDPIFVYKPTRKVGVEEQYAYLITDMLRDVINGGTGYAIRSKYQFTGDCAGKTGTTNNFTDAWFIGYTPQVSLGVWVGFDDPAQSIGNRQTGGVIALPVWAETITKAFEKKLFFDEPFKVPASIDTTKIPLKRQIEVVEGAE